LTSSELVWPVTKWFDQLRNGLTSYEMVWPVLKSFDKVKEQEKLSQ
jgi:hypothetical protein